MTYHHLALKGGGARGYIYVGAFQALFKLGLLENINAISGSSVGAISALFACSGFSMQEFKEKIFSIDFEKLIFNQWVINEPINWLEHFGLHDGKALYELFQSLVKEATGDENTTFKQWHAYQLAHPEKNLKDIYVEACNISLGYNQIFSHNSPLCDTPVALAIAASMAVPQYFEPKIINGDYYSDGATQANCPVGVFEHPKGEPNPNTLGIWLDNHHNIELFNKGILPPRKKINHVFNCISAQIDASLNTQNFDLLESKYKKQMIYCDTLGIGTLQFDLTLAQKNALVASGEYGVLRFVAQHLPELAGVHYPQFLIAAITALEFPVSLQGFLQKLNSDPILSLSVNLDNLDLNATQNQHYNYIQQWSSLDFFKVPCPAEATMPETSPNPAPVYTPQFTQTNLPCPNSIPSTPISVISMTSTNPETKKTCTLI